MQFDMIIYDEDDYDFSFFFYSRDDFVFVGCVRLFLQMIRPFIN